MENKRDTIIARSWELFRKYGIKSISMDDIAREMGMSKKTLYYIIKDKKELVGGVIGLVKELITESWAVFHDENLTSMEQHYKQKETIEDLLKHFNPTFSYDLQKYYPDLYRELNNWRKNVIIEAHISNIEKGKREGFFRSDIRSDVIAKLIVAHHIFTFDPTNEIFDIKDIIDFQVVEQVHLYHLRGMCSLKGLDEIEKLFYNDKKLDND